MRIWHSHMRQQITAYRQSFQSRLLFCCLYWCFSRSDLVTIWRWWNLNVLLLQTHLSQMVIRNIVCQTKCAPTNLFLNWPSVSNHISEMITLLDSSIFSNFLALFCNESKKMISSEVNENIAISYQLFYLAGTLSFPLQTWMQHICGIVESCCMMGLSLKHCHQVSANNHHPCKNMEL